MNRAFKATIAAITLAIGIAGSLAAGPFEEGEDAAKRGDYATAMRLWRPLADQGNAIAQEKLGAMYATGRGVARDDAAALSWFRKAADQSIAEAQLILGLMYADGRGVPQNYISAYMWYTLAIPLFPDSDRAKRDGTVNLRNELAAKMSSAQIAEGRTMSEHCLRSNYADCGSPQVARREDKVIPPSTPRNALNSTSAEVRGGFGCDRSSEGSVCFPDGGCTCGFKLEIDGEIDSTTVDKVKKLFDVRRAHNGEAESEGFAINSPGGSVAAAMTIGRMFRKERAWLTVSNNGVCVSACVFILAGAVERVSLAKKVGIHRPYLTTIPRTLTTDQVKSTYKGVLQDMRAYLREMNVSDRLADDMLAIEPEKVRYLNEVELSRYGLLGVDPAEQETRATENEAQNVQEANQLGLDRPEYTRRKALADQMCSNMTVPKASACQKRILKTGR